MSSIVNMESFVQSGEEHYIEITHDFNKSDTIYSKIPIDHVEDYLTRHVNCYERTIEYI
jgi:hypothetical protein